MGRTYRAEAPEAPVLVFPFSGSPPEGWEAMGVELPLRLDLVNHSPTGFSWGYGGSGPAQLALAILADYFEHVAGLDAAAAGAEALRLHQSFKWHAIAPLDRLSGFVLESGAVATALVDVGFKGPTPA